MPEEPINRPCIVVAATNPQNYYRFLRWARRKGEPRCSRRSSQCCSGMVAKTSTTLGSNWIPYPIHLNTIKPIGGRDGSVVKALEFLSGLDR
jgi:hypothetical protein